MAISCAIRFKMLPIILLFRWVSVAGSGNCQTPPAGNCLQKCYEECKENGANENDTLKLENILMAKHMCDSKCRTEFLTFKMEEDPDKNVLECAGVCKKPMHEYCKSGYIAKFFYCDCLSCCKKFGGFEILKCREGCYEYFERLDEHVYTTNACKFRAEYTDTKSAWCHAWCVWKLHTLEIVQIKEVPKIGDTKVLNCTTECSKFVGGGKEVDYSSKTPLKCQEEKDYWKCVTLAEIMKINISSVSNKDIKSLPGGASVFKDKKTLSKINNQDGIQREYAIYTFVLDYKGNVTIKLSLPESLKFIKENGGNVTGVDSIGLVSDSSRTSKIPWDKLGPLIQEGFKNWNNPVAIAYDVDFKVKKKLETMYCTQFNAIVNGTMKEMKNVQMEFVANISDSKSSVPLDIIQLEKALQNKPELMDLTFVMDVNDFVIRVKGTMSMDITFPDFPIVFEDCSKGKNCFIQNDWSPSTACWDSSE